MFSNGNFQPPLRTRKNLNYKEKSQHLLNHPVTFPNTAHPPEYHLPEQALKRNKQSFQKHKQGCKAVSKKQMMFSTGKNMLLKAEFLHGFPCKPKVIVIKLWIHNYLMSLRWFVFRVDSFAFQENGKWMLDFI